MSSKSDKAVTDQVQALTGRDFVAEEGLWLVDHATGEVVLFDGLGNALVKMMRSFTDPFGFTGAFGVALFDGSGNIVGTIERVDAGGGNFVNLFSMKDRPGDVGSVFSANDSSGNEVAALGTGDGIALGSTSFDPLTKRIIIHDGAGGAKFAAQGDDGRIGSISDLGLGLADAEDALDASAGFQMDHTDKGLLPPRLTTAQRDAIGAPADGLFVYNTDVDKYQRRDGANWHDLPLKYSEVINGNDVTTQFTVMHNLNSQAVVVSVKDETDDAHVEPDVLAINANNVRIDFAVAPATGQDYLITVIG